MTDQNLLLQENGYPNVPDIKAQLRNLNDDSEYYTGEGLLEDSAAHIEHLERELVEARKDAERYQWLRERLAGYDFEWGEPPMACVVFEVGNDFRGSRDISGSIDAAIAKEKP